MVTDLLPSILNPRAVSPYHVERDNEETTGTIFCENTSSKSSKSGDSFLMISDSFYIITHIISYHIISDIIFLSARPDIPGNDHSFTVHMPPVFGGICLRNFFCSIGSLPCQLRRNPFQKDGEIQSWKTMASSSSGTYRCVFFFILLHHSAHLDVSFLQLDQLPILSIPPFSRALMCEKISASAVEGIEAMIESHIRWFWWHVS